MRTPDSPENYNAFKDSQRRQNEKRQQFRVVTRLAGDDSSPVSDEQLANDVAKQTGSAPAPEDIVRANRELFREASDRAWAEKIGREAPITLVVAGDPKNVSRPREYFDALASLEQVAGKLVTAPQASTDGTAWERGRLNSPSIRNADFVDELAAVRQQVNEHSGGHPAPSGGQGNSNGLRPGEKVINVEVVPDSDVPASLPRSDPAADPTSDNAQSGSSSADSRNSTSSTEASAGRGDNSGLRSGERVVTVEVVPEPRSSSTNSATASTPLPGDVEAKAPPNGTGEQSVMPGIGPEKAPALGSSLPFGSDPSIPNVTTFEMPQIKLPDAPSAGASLALGIAGLGKNPGYWVVAAYRDLIDKQSDIPKDLALSVLDGVITGSLTQEKALARLTEGSSTAVPDGGLALGGAEGFGLDDGISPDSYMPFRPRSEPILPERTFELPEIPLSKDAPSKRAALSEAIAGLGKNPGYYVVAALKDLISKQPDLPQDIALDVLNKVASGSLTREQALDRLLYTPLPDREKLADEIANAAMLTEEQAKALEERLKKQPYIPVDRALEVFRSVRHMDYGPGPAKNLLMATTDEELANLTERMVLAKGKNPEEIAAVRRGLYEQNAADPAVSDMYFTGFINGYVTEGQLRKIMERHGFVGSVIELVNRTFGSQYKSVGGIIKFLYYYVGMPETEEWKRRKALIDDVLHLKGKSAAEFDAVYQRILDNDDPGSLVEAWNAMKEGKDPEEVSKMFPSYPLGDGALAHSKEFVTPGWENSIAGRVGDAAGPLVNAALLDAAFRNGWVGALYLALDGGATNHAAAVAADADAKTIRTSDAEATVASFLTNLSPVKWLLGAAPLRKFAGGAIEDMVDGTYGIGMQVVQQTSLNAIAQSYDKHRALFQDVGPAAAAGAILWGLKIAGRAGLGRFGAAIDAYSLRNNISEAQEAIRRDVILKEFNDIIEQNAPIVSNKRKEIADFIQQKVTNKSNENLYFQVDKFKESLTKAGIDPLTFVESLGGVTLGDFQGATKAGGYVRVPLAAFAAYVMGTKASKALMEHATFKPGAKSPAMSEEFLKNLLMGKSNGTATVPPDGKPAPTYSFPEDKAGQS
ncbi:hypothetical protein ANOBCDAF_03949 [Pleomorphomonas sp. T1.2MG-36]|uniref:hypothetical protein n=1 Tax=Pleomorphomonas sp. T1.2MG-36 TaxID=3041167 RepID=UPI002477B849|nr:hypothetical protein [Pleomorphomonas sp. T1.2MG-36]CAI9417326.1 hypothetical protein ANOBCDAF_03949 [Pleomorphomonas sp. T1.2MG-36]